MAKRQTIWLSTMMVLSLMLIGFYTVNNNTQAVLSNDNSKIASDQKTAANTQTTKPVVQQSDYFMAQHLDLEKQIDTQIEQLQQQIANPKSTADQVSQAQQQLDTLNANQEKIGNLHDELTATGYPDALITMNSDSKVDVIVEAQNLDKTAAVKIMDMAQKQFPNAEVSVGFHS